MPALFTNLLVTNKLPKLYIVGTRVDGDISQARFIL